MKEEITSPTQRSAGTTRRSCPSLPQQKITAAVAILLAGFLFLCGFSQTYAADFSGSLKSVSITDAGANNPPPVVSFTYTVNGSTVVFNASVASGNVTEFNWDFGDNTKGNGITATHQYNSQGTYPITLTAIEKNGSAVVYQSSVSLALSPSPPPSSGKLLHQSNLKYLGAFRLPGVPIGCDSWTECSFAYGGRPFAFNPRGNGGKGSLFIGSHIYTQKVAEVSIPNLVNSNNLNELNTAQVLQGFSDITEGNRNNVMLNSAHYNQTVNPGGLFVDGDKLIGSVQTYYDGGDQYLSHYIFSSTNLSETGKFAGMYKISDAVGARFLAGYIDSIPQAWQEKLGGKLITGVGGLGIISTTSVGPSAFAFDPANLGVKNPVPATSLMYYPLEHALADPGSTNSLFNVTATIRGVVFPDGSDSVLFFGSIGVGEYCYGFSCADPSLVGKPIPGATMNELCDCYDPANSGKGPHMYPIKYQVWAYSANDFVKVKNGELKPWDVRPYETWNFTLPFQPKEPEILGTSYDRTNGKLYVSQARGEDDRPLVHVFEIVP